MSVRRSAEGSNVAVFGVGCVGLSILQGCRAKKCAKVIAIDTNPKKAEWAKKFGASTPNSHMTAA
jgi:S-(hydroxymethyl)glutathione dehydrogenase/alcohol dehydrogenase